MQKDNHSPAPSQPLQSSGLLTEAQLDICRQLATGPQEFSLLQSRLGIPATKLLEDLAAIGSTALGPLRQTAHQVAFNEQTCLLSPAKILSRLGKGTDAHRLLSPTNLQVLLSADSGNEVVRRQATRPFVVFCEQQVKGRGRYGRIWQSPFGAGLFLSAIFTKDTFKAAGTGGLSLAVGVMMLRALHKLQLQIKLKWPNDLLDVRGNKLAGILIEILEEDIVIGIGMNHTGSGSAATGTTSGTSPGTSLCEMAQRAKQPIPERNATAARMLDALFAGVRQFAKDGFASFCEEWKSADYLHSKKIVVHDGGRHTGICVGINTDGALLLQDSTGKEHRIYSGTLQDTGQQ